MKAVLIQLKGITAHFRDPRYNTGKVGKMQNLSIRTLRCPPPCTIHGLLCAAKGGWVDTNRLIVGWRTEFTEVCSDFQTCRLPQRGNYSFNSGIQKVDISPREREFLAFPVLTVLIISGAEADWFRQPANPLCLGRSEDLVVETHCYEAACSSCENGTIRQQCLPIGIGHGLLYPAPLYFESNRRPVGMFPKTDAITEQEIHSDCLIKVHGSNEIFYTWNFANVTR